MKAHGSAFIVRKLIEMGQELDRCLRLIQIEADGHLADPGTLTGLHESASIIRDTLAQLYETETGETL